MTAPERWEPDTQMVPAVLATPKAARPMADLSDPDRSWLVAGLTMAGVTAQDIADRLGCSLRLIRAIRAEPMTQMVVLWQQSERAADDELRAERCEHGVTRQELGVVRAERDRLRMQVDKLFDAFVSGERIETFPLCGHPKVDWNVYLHRGRERREYCRECNRLRASKYRKRRKAAGRDGNHTKRVTVLHAVAIASGS